MTISPEIVLAGVTIPPHRMLEVVDHLPRDEGDDERRVLTAGEARALVSAGLAEPVAADFGHLPALIERWQAL